MSRLVLPAARRFDELVDTSGDCWLWTGSLNNHGYGQFWLGPNLGYGLAHRWSYEQHVGPIPAGLTLDHTCGQPRCARPEHLEPVTLRVNILRGDSPAAQHARQTHCLRGHAFDGTNTRLYRGKRTCRVCETTRKRQSRTSSEGVQP